MQMGNWDNYTNYIPHQTEHLFAGSRGSEPSPKRGGPRSDRERWWRWWIAPGGGREDVNHGDDYCGWGGWLPPEGGSPLNYSASNGPSVQQAVTTKGTRWGSTPW